MMACISALLATPCPPKGPNPSVLRASPSPAVAPFSNAWMTVPVLRSSKFRCWSGASPPPPAPPPVDSGETDASKKRDVSPYSWCAGLGALGFLETCYLTFLKVTDSEAFCPVGGGSCGDVLNSDYAVVFGSLLIGIFVALDIERPLFLSADQDNCHYILVLSDIFSSGIPLPLYGTIAYGFVALLGLQLSGKKIFSGLGESDVRLILLGCTTSMATASAYFLYLLSTKLSGALCPYCLFSAVLSFSLFFITVKDFGFQEIQKTVGVQLAIAGIVVAALSYSYSTARSQLPGLNDIDLQPFETVITTESTPFAISLAKHLRSVGAKMYGAFWCSHCIEQKQMFGREAMKIVDYVECFPDGFGRGRKMVKVCTDAGIEGFPTWLIRNQVLSGEQELSDLAQASGFVVDDFHPS